jgi:hypothetical protein
MRKNTANNKTKRKLENVCSARARKSALAGREIVSASKERPTKSKPTSVAEAVPIRI